MISNLSKSEFKENLEKFTKVGNPEIKTTPFGLLTIFSQSLKRFYGEYNSSTFRLTLNALIFISTYIIEGSYKSRNKTETKIKYKVVQSWYGFIVTKIIAILILGSINFAIIPEGSDIWNYIIANLLGLSLVIFTFYMEFRLKKQLVRDFHRIFEIQNENE